MDTRVPRIELGFCRKKSNFVPDIGVPVRYSPVGTPHFESHEIMLEGHIISCSEGVITKIERTDRRPLTSPVA